jgi:hypothetical protein
MSEAQAVMPGYDAPAGQRDGLQADPSERLCSREDCRKPLTGRQSKWCSDACYWRVWDKAHPRVGRARQAALPGESRVERAFAEWIASAAGRYVEREVIRLAREDKAAGDRRGEMNLYLALVRRSSRGLTKDRCGFRCNQNHRSFLARKLMAEQADLRDFFETRELRGRA